MTAYLIRRFGTSIIVLIGISIFVFGLLHIVYPSPARVILGPKASLLAISEWNAQHGFNGSVVSQYWHYVDGVLHGNFGYSFKLNQSVTSLFSERWMLSAYLSGVSLALSVIIAIPLGIYQAAKRNSIGDNVLTTVTFTAYAMPDFLLYLIAIQVFAISLRVFSVSAPSSTNIVTVIGDWKGMTLPIVCMTLLILAGNSRYMRSSAMDVLAQDYIKAARA